MFFANYQNKVGNFLRAPFELTETEGEICYVNESVPISQEIHSNRATVYLLLGSVVR